MTEEGPSAGAKAQAVLLGLVPGLAHILVLGRPGTGLALFLLCDLGAFAALAGRFLVDAPYSPDLLTWGAAAAGSAWLVAFLDVARLALFRDYRKRAETRRRLAGEGVRGYAAGDLGAARTAFRHCLALDSRDADALFWYGCVEARRGKVRRARRAFRRCRKHDAEGKWSFECDEQEGRLTGRRDR